MDILTPKDINLLWPPLSAITCSNLGRKLLQIFLTKPFFVDRHERFAEALSFSVLLWRVLQLFLNMRPQAEVDEIQIW